MAEVVVNPNLNERVWLRQNYVQPYLRASGLDAYMGSSQTAIIRVITATETNGGKDVVVPLLGVLRGEGVRDSQVLEGNEEDMESSADLIRCSYRRNAVKVPKSSSYRTNIDILNVAAPRLKEWAAKVVLKKGVIDNLQGIIIPGAASADNGAMQPDMVASYFGTATNPTTAAQRNVYLGNNTDRILFGIDIANASSGVFSTALANIDATNDRLTPALISKARRIAQATADIDSSTASNSITPYMLDNGEEWYVMLVHPRAMRDLRTDATMTQANRDAMERGKDNPLFRAGDLMWEGVIIHEMRDMQLVPGAGAAGIDVACSVLLGQSAVAVAYGEEPRIITDTKQDYQFRPATAVQECIGIKQLSFGGRQFGKVSVWTAATADS